VNAIHAWLVVERVNQRMTREIKLLVVENPIQIFIVVTY
jgi:hypothetical protein